jgi:ATP-dependent Lon protease
VGSVEGIRISLERVDDDLLKKEEAFALNEQIRSLKERLNVMEEENIKIDDELLNKKDNSVLHDEVKALKVQLNVMEEEKIGDRQVQTYININLLILYIRLSIIRMCLIRGNI